MKLKDLITIIATHVCIEEGIRDNWYYRKYADGRLEAEQIWNVGQVTVGTQVSSTWRRSADINIADPPMMVSGTVIVELVGNTSNSPVVLEHYSNKTIAIAKASNASVTLQNVTLALRTVDARWKL